MSRSIRVAVLTASVLTLGEAPLSAQSVTIRGRVIHAHEPMGLSGVELVLKPSGAKTRTDPNGTFVFYVVAPADVVLSARRPGFVEAIRSLRIVASDTAGVEIQLEPIVGMLDPVIMSATPLEPRQINDVPVAVSVIDSSRIERGNTIGLQETLRSMPGVQVASRWGTDDVWIGIRGSGARRGPAPRGIAILMDGVPLTESDGAGRLDLIDLATTRQIEVMRGPSSALYAGSSGGVVNVVSRTGRDSKGLTLRAQDGAFGTHKYYGRVGGVFAEARGSAMAAGSYTSTAGYREHSDGVMRRGQVGIDYAPGQATHISLQAAGSWNDVRSPGSLNQTEIDVDPRAVSPLFGVFAADRVDNRYRVGGQAETQVGATVTGAYLFLGGRTLDLRVPNAMLSANFQRTQAGVRSRSSRFAGLPLVVTGGVDYDQISGTDRRWQSQRGGIRGASVDDGTDAVPRTGVYGEVEWQTSAAVTTTLGWRYDYVTYRFESVAAGGIPRQETTFHQGSPRLAAVWHPSGAASAYASIGHGFENPAIGEVSPRPGAPLQPTRPKTLWNYEIGGRRIMGSRTRIDGAVFLALVRGEFVPMTISGLSFSENASRSRNLGAELGLTSNVTPWLDVTGGYTFLDLRFTDYTSSVVDSTGARRVVDFSGKQLPAVPRHRVAGEATFRPMRRLSIGVQAEWQGIVYVETSNSKSGMWYSQSGGAVQETPFSSVPARTLLHLNGSMRFGAATLFSAVENVLGEKYVANVVANESVGRFYEPGLPRWATFGLNLALRPGRLGDHPPE